MAVLVPPGFSTIESILTRLSKPPLGSQSLTLGRESLGVEPLQFVLHPFYVSIVFYVVKIVFGFFADLSHFGITYRAEQSISAYSYSGFRIRIFVSSTI